MIKKLKTIVIVSAMPQEISYVDTIAGNREGWHTENHAYVNTSAGVNVLTKVMGVGKVTAAAATADLINEWEPDLIVNVGFAGGLKSDAHTGDVAIGNHYVQVDFIPYFDENRPYTKDTDWSIDQKLKDTADFLQIPSYIGTIATGDFFLHDNGQKLRIKEEFNPIAFDMESAAVAQVATAKDVPFVGIRTFSDLADDHAAELARQYKEEGHRRIPIEQRPVAILIKALEDGLLNQ